MVRLCLIASLLFVGCSKSGRSDEAPQGASPTPGPTPAAPATPTPKPAQPGQPATNKKAPMSKLPPTPIPVKLSLTEKGDVLQVRYSINNTSDKRYYVGDKLIRGAGKNTYETLERLSVLNTKLAPEAIAFFLGSPQPSTPAVWHIPITYVAVEPGAKHEGTREVPLPIEPFDVHGVNKPLARPADKVVLMVSAFEGEPPRWKELAGADGKPIRYPEEALLQIWFAGPEPLPTPLK